MSNPFDYVSAVSHSKQNLMSGSENDELAEKDYVPYLVNKALSYHIDSVIEANTMNTYGHLDNKMQFEYLLNTLRKRKRYAKWLKPVANSDLEAVMECYSYNRAKAEAALKCMTADDILAVHNRVYKGGIYHEQRKHTRESSGGDA